MHYVLTPVGSSGDVHPYVGIGKALKSRGHTITIITTDVFRDLCESSGFGFVGNASAEEYDEVTRNPDLWHPRRGTKLVLQLSSARLRTTYESIATVYQPGKTVLVGHTLSLATRLFEEVHGCPAATLHLAPTVFRSDYQQPATLRGVDPSSFPRWLKRAAWWMVDRLFIDPALTPELNTFRRRLGLPPVRRVFNTWIHSPQRVIGLFPSWFAPPQPDWPHALRLTSFPLYDEADQHPAVSSGLDDFLRNGTPPVVFTPGSANRLAGTFFRTAVDAIQRLNLRAVFLTRYPEQLPELPTGIRHEPYVPLSQVLPRCQALVHHGGIGTCAQGLAAGIPQLTMPLGFDQPDNTMRLVRLGVGSWVMPADFSGPRLEDALTRLLTPEVNAACQTWKEALRIEAPLSDVCDLLENVSMSRT